MKNRTKDNAEAHLQFALRALRSPLLGVKGTVIITHGRARRRMVTYGIGVAATMARTRVPDLIAEAFAGDAGTPADRKGTAIADESSLESVS